jgi:hypothetical protein
MRAAPLAIAGHMHIVDSHCHIHSHSHIRHISAAVGHWPLADKLDNDFDLSLSLNMCQWRG